MPIYSDNGTGNLTDNPVLPSVLCQGDDKYLLGTSFAIGAAPTPGIIQTPNDANVNAEIVVAGDRSIAIALSPRPDGGAAPGLSVLLVADKDPGAMEVDVQTANTDADGAYQTPTSSTAYVMTTWAGPKGPLGKYVASAQFQPLGDRFVTLKVVSNPNAAKLTAKVTYV